MNYTVIIIALINIIQFISTKQDSSLILWLGYFIYKLLTININ